jgi:outer membrane lipoprotein carrier protein
MTSFNLRIYLLISLALFGASTEFAQSQIVQNQSAQNQSPRINSLDLLAQFMKTTQSGVSHFSQVVSSPTQEGRKAKVKNSEGVFAFSRPNHFRFDYVKPFVQTIVADGQTLWIYDVDISQITARAQDKALGSTPASLIASAPDLSALEKDFVLTNEPDLGNLQWVQATPKLKDSQLHFVRIGLSPSADQVSLSKLEILDAFGQKSVMTFDRFDTNPNRINATTFKFTPPQGVEVIRP